MCLWKEEHKTLLFKNILFKSCQSLFEGKPVS